MMTRATFIFAISMQLTILSSVIAQQKVINLSDSARYYYKKKDFKKAFDYYEAYHLSPTRGVNNIDTYYAAVAAGNVNNMERAKYYLKRSADIGYDIPNYKKYQMDSDAIPLNNLPEWIKYFEIFKFKSDSLVTALDRINKQLADTTIRANKSLLLNNDYWKDIASKSSASQLVDKIKRFNTYPSTSKKGFWTLYNIKVNDTVTVPFLVHIPKDYNPKQKTSLYVYLHGAVVNRPQFVPPAYVIDGQEIKIMAKAMEQNAFIIYPFGKRDFGWIYHQNAFETVIKEITFVKSLYNINDNKVYIGGHSNGGSGAFWFAMNQPNNFAAFFGLNYLPKAYVGNTNLRNLTNNTTFYGVSGSDDPVFPITTVNAIYNYSVANGSNWKNFTKKGDHGLPFESPDSINFIFPTLATNTRNPCPKKITWETDNIKNGRNAWIEIIELDTLAEKASWHTSLNPTVTQNEKTEVIELNKNKSGAILATLNGNTINIKTSRVKRIKIYVAADMLDLNQQIKLIINDKDYLNFKLSADKNIILEEFAKTKDRDFIVANKIELTIK